MFFAIGGGGRPLSAIRLLRKRAEAAGGRYTSTPPVFWLKLTTIPA